MESEVKMNHLSAKTVPRHNRFQSALPAPLAARLARLLRRALALRDSRCPWERAVWFTRGFRAADAAEPAIIRRARALKYTLEHVPLRLRPDEVFAGDTLRKLCGPPGVADQHAWTSGVTAPESWLRCDPAHVPETVARELAWWGTQRSAPPWQDTPLGERLCGLIEEGVMEHPKGYFGHVIPFFEAALEKGYTGIRADAKARLAATPPDGDDTTARRDFYRAVILACDGAIAFGARYAARARALAARTRRAERREQLLEIAAVCDWVPALPPRTFREALQMVWFVHWFNEEEAPAVHTHSFGRFDQYLYPFYRRDVDAGRLTREEALALVAAFWIKCYRTFEQRHTMLGGQTRDGGDGANELTDICLDAIALVGTPRATGVRIGSRSSDAFLDRLLDVLDCGLGVPALYNDDAIIPAFVDRGVPAMVAADYGVTGCVELAIAGHAEFITVSQFVNPAKVLELALNDGCSLLTGKRVGPATGTAATLTSMEAVRATFERQLDVAMETACAAACAAERRLAAEQPMPLFSSLMPGCMERGRDTLAGGADYNFSGMCLAEVATTANSLAAIERLVFEERRLSLVELVEILRRNFDGAEDLRQQALHRMPKFGTDDPAADRHAAFLVRAFDAALRGRPHARGGAYLPLIFSRQHRQTQFGARTAATADGRKSGEILAVSLNPVPGTADRGLTALLKSQNSLPLRLLAGGVSNNVDIDPRMLKGPERDRMIALLRAWLALGGMEMAILVMDPAKLRAAQVDPERYRDLTVRVYGFSERYINLSRQLQDYLYLRAAGGEG